jgi:sarcosine oxidase
MNGRRHADGSRDSSHGRDAQALGEAGGAREGAAATSEAGRAPAEAVAGASASAGSAKPDAGIDRRSFLRRTGMGAGALAAAGSLGGVLTACDARALSRGNGSEVVVVGAGAFGTWTALNLQDMGARVTLLDMYGPGNSRSTSGDETRGVRSSYGEREHWCDWANRAMERWRAFDEEWSGRLLGQLFFSAGDLILRDSWAGLQEESARTWDRLGVPYERLDHDEIAYRWPQINIEGIEVGLFEPGAGVVRSRAACQSVAEVFRRRGGEIRIARAQMGESIGGRLQDLVLEDGERLAADRFVFALGPWLPKAFPELMGGRIRISTMGHVYYFGTPPGDHRFSHPNLPSYNFPGLTGWATLPLDNRGLRIRTGGRGADDPDTSVRWIPESYHEQPRSIIAERFPAMADQPLVETRACHYESSVTRDWFIDRHPGMENAWIAGGGSAEGFKFGPMLGELIAGRVLGDDRFPELTENFRLREDDVAPSEQAAHPAERSEEWAE